MKFTVLFEGKEVDLKEIEAWERRHSVTMAKRLQRRYGVKLPGGFLQSIPHTEIEAIRQELVKAKLCLGTDGIRRRLWGTLALTDRIAEAMTVFSGHRKKSSVVDILVQDLQEGFDLERFCAAILGLMTLNSEENAAACLAGSPDHLVLEGKGERVQEIIEITGGAPMESRFLNYYGVEDGVDYPRDASYPIQMAGVSRL